MEPVEAVEYQVEAVPAGPVDHSQPPLAVAGRVGQVVVDIVIGKVTDGAAAPDLF